MIIRMGILIAVAMSVALSAAMANDEGAFSAVVSDTGEIALPSDFRARMTHLGSWYVPEGGASGFHDVYANPDAVTVYRKTGEFPDGTVLVKELRGSNAGDYTTGSGVSYATDGIKQWFVMVKDRQGRFAGHPLWGDGWGWALFKPNDPTVNVANDYTADCLGCHLPARANDLIYVEAYPTLK